MYHYISVLKLKAHRVTDSPKERSIHSQEKCFVAGVSVVTTNTSLLH